MCCSGYCALRAVDISNPFFFIIQITIFKIDVIANILFILRVCVSFSVATEKKTREF